MEWSSTKAKSFNLYDLCSGGSSCLSHLDNSHNVFVTTCMSLPAHNLKGQLLFEWFLTLVCSGSILSASSFFRNENQRQKAMLWQHSPAMPGSYLFLFLLLGCDWLSPDWGEVERKTFFWGTCCWILYFQLYLFKTCGCYIPSRAQKGLN